MKSRRIFFPLFISFFLLAFTSATNAQEIQELQPNNIYVEASVGSFSRATINYERRFFSGSSLTWYGRVGFGATSNSNASTGFGGLAAVSMLTGKKRSHFEVDAGAMLFTEGSRQFVYPVVNLGYRYQNPEGGLLVKAHVGIISFGLGLGYSF